MLVWHAGTHSHTVWNRLGKVANTVSKRWAVVFETLDTRLEHVGGWLTGAHVKFWTCRWFSHTVFTRSRHTSRCDCALKFCGICLRTSLQEILKISILDTRVNIAYWGLQPHPQGANVLTRWLLLTNWGLTMQLCLSELSHFHFMSFVICQAPSHHLHQCWMVTSWALGKKCLEF